MRDLRPVVIAIALLSAVASPVSAETFKFDKGFTLLTFTWSHLGLSRQQARFNDVDGTIELDPEHPETSTADVTIRVASLQSGTDTFDRILRSADYFNAAAFPTITFHATTVERTGEQTADLTGDLKILGITKPVTLHVTLNLYGEHPSGAANPAYLNRKVAAFSAVARVLRSSWGLSRGIPLVSDEVDIAIETELLAAQ